MGFSFPRYINLHNLTLNEILTLSLMHVDELLTRPKQMSIVAWEDFRHQH